MFDLSNSLNDWRNHLRQGEGCREDNIDELEEHLREEMAALARIGLSDEETFLLATRRLGRVESLKAEFEKVNTSFVWTNRLRWMGVGALTCLAALTAEAAFRRLLIAGSALADLNSYVVGVLSPIASLAVMVLVVVLAVNAFAHRNMLGRSTYTSSRGAQCVFLLGVLLWFTAIPLCSMLTSTAIFRYTSPSEVGRMTIATSIGEAALTVVLPLLVAGWMLKMRRLSY